MSISEPPTWWLWTAIGGAMTGLAGLTVAVIALFQTAQANHTADDANRLSADANAQASKAFTAQISADSAADAANIQIDFTLNRVNEKYQWDGEIKNLTRHDIENVRISRDSSKPGSGIVETAPIRILGCSIASLPKLPDELVMDTATSNANGTPKISLTVTWTDIAGHQWGDDGGVRYASNGFVEINGAKTVKVLQLTEPAPPGTCN